MVVHLFFWVPKKHEGKDFSKHVIQKLLGVPLLQMRLADTTGRCSRLFPEKSSLDLTKVVERLAAQTYYDFDDISCIYTVHVYI